MSEQEQRLVLDLAFNRISREEFLRPFPTDFGIDPAFTVDRYLKAAVNDKDSRSLSAAMILATEFGCPDNYATFLADVLLQDWHHSHEVIAGQLQNLRDPNTVDALAVAATMELPYLAFDTFYALGVKCIWALNDIGTPKAVVHLKELSHSSNRILRKNARERLRERTGLRNTDAETTFKK